MSQFTVSPSPSGSGNCRQGLPPARPAEAAFPRARASPLPAHLEPRLRSQFRSPLSRVFSPSGKPRTGRGLSKDRAAAWYPVYPWPWSAPPLTSVVEARPQVNFGDLSLWCGYCAGGLVRKKRTAMPCLPGLSSHPSSASYSPSPRQFSGVFSGWGRDPRGPRIRERQGLTSHPPLPNSGFAKTSCGIGAPKRVAEEPGIRSLLETFFLLFRVLTTLHAQTQKTLQIQAPVAELAQSQHLCN